MYKNTRIWNKKYISIPVINRSHQNSNKRFAEIFGSHNRKHSIDSLQKTAVFGPSLIIWRELLSVT